MMEYIYMAIEKDKYELPYCVADTAEELATKMGVSKKTIRTSINKYERGIYKFSKYIRVKI